MTNQNNREEALNRYANRLEILHKIDEAILESATIDDLTYTALHVVNQLVKYDHAGIIELQENQYANVYEGIFQNGRFSENIINDQTCSNLMLETIQQNETAFLSDPIEIQLLLKNLLLSENDTVNTCMVVPLVAKQEHLGLFVVGFSSSESLSFELNEIIKEVSKMLSIGMYQIRLYEKVEMMATIDELTGIYNRRQLIQLGEHSLAQAIRSESPFSIILFDIDHFKEVNDTYGHTTGDKMLQKIVKCCKQNVRQMDIFGRYGGDEFVVILPDTTMEQAELVAKRLNARVFTNTELLDECPIQLSISVGISFLEDKEQTLTQLINQADEAMYIAKKSGRNRINLYKSPPFEKPNPT
jgi:diguanylate cyclase (GGDEF)-like protein